MHIAHLINSFYEYLFFKYLNQDDIFLKPKEKKVLVSYFYYICIVGFLSGIFSPDRDDF